MRPGACSLQLAGCWAHSEAPKQPCHLRPLRSHRSPPPQLEPRRRSAGRSEARCSGLESSANAINELPCPEREREQNDERYERGEPPLGAAATPTVGSGSHPVPPQLVWCASLDRQRRPPPYGEERGPPLPNATPPSGGQHRANGPYLFLADAVVHSEETG